MQAGYIYHARTLSNERFCKIGMTSGRNAKDRIQELNAAKYAGFADWYVAAAIVVSDPLTVESELHSFFRDRKIKVGPEQELFLLRSEEVEAAFHQYRSVPMEKFLELEVEKSRLIKQVGELRSTISFLKQRMEQLEASHAKELHWMNKRQDELINENEKKLRELREENIRIYGEVFGETDEWGESRAPIKKRKRDTRSD